MSLIYTIDIDYSFDKIFRNLAFILVPIGFYLTRRKNIDLKKGKLVFLIAWVIFCLFSLGSLLYYWLNFPQQRQYYNFIQDSMYHNYMPHDAMYICTALIFLLFSFKNLNQYVKLIVSTLFLFVLILFGVRLGIFQFLLIILVYIFKYRNKVINIKNIVILLIISILSFFILHSNSYTKDKFYSSLNSINIEVGKNKMTEISNDYHRINFRLEIWPLAYELIKEKPFIGYGAGTEQDLLYELSQKRDLNIIRVHAHNDFLSIAIQYGLTGLFTFLFVLLYIFYKATSNLEHTLIFIIIILMSMFTHSYLHVQQGIFYFVIFSSIILKFSHKKINTTNLKKYIKISSHSSEN